MERLGRRWVLVLLVATAAVLRLSLISSARFTGDEAIIYRAIVGIHDGTAYPELGPNVTGGAARTPGALFYYLLSVSQFFSRTPEAANAEAAIFGALAVGFLWSAVEIMCGGFAAFVAALLMTFSPWSLLFADRMWSPNVIIFVVAVAFWAAVHSYKNPKSPKLSLLVALCMVMPQFHPSAPVIWIALAMIVFPKRGQWSRRWLGAGILAGAIAYIPYLHSEFVSGFANLRALQVENLHQEEGWQIYKVPIYAFRFLTLDTTYHELMGYWGGVDEVAAVKAAFLGSPVRPFSVFRLAALISSVILAGMIYVSAYRERKRLGIFWRACVAGVIADAVLLAITGKPFYPHYLTPLLPFLFALAAGLAHRMERSAQLRKAVCVLLAIFCIGGAEAALSISRGLDARNGLSTQRGVIEVILADARQEQWPARTQVGLGFGFPALLDGYSALLEEIYHSELTVGNEGRSLNPGAPAPQYALLDMAGRLPFQSPEPAHPIGSDGLVLYRMK